MNEPTQRCMVCGAVEVVRQMGNGRAFPPDVAKKRLIKRCAAEGHVCEPRYRAGFMLTRPEGQ